MKSPQALANLLRRQWESADKREARLIPGNDAWPLRLPIGRPSAKTVAGRIDALREHIRDWDAVQTGTVEWERVGFRATAEPIEIPRAWRLDKPSDWIAACGDEAVSAEYADLARLCDETPPLDHPIWIRSRYLWRGKPIAEIVRASRLADTLRPGCAEGRPLRALAHAGVDSKFYERHRALLVRLLDLRHHGTASEQGLESFLDAEPEGTHWLLLADLDGGLLPFRQQRVRATDLENHPGLPASRILAVENDRALHLLPAVTGCLAVLGSGNNLSWLAAPWLANKQVGYWGDLDTWGLSLLARARRHRPDLTPLLMDAATFDRHAPGKSVAEPECAQMPTEGLDARERSLFEHLRASRKGRLEQEFLHPHAVSEAIQNWSQTSGDSRDPLPK